MTSEEIRQVAREKAAEAPPIPREAADRIAAVFRSMRPETSHRPTRAA